MFAARFSINVEGARKGSRAPGHGGLRTVPHMRIRAIVTNRGAAWIVLVVLAPAGLRADLLYFAQGGRVQIPAESRGDGTVRLELPDGPAVFAASDFRKIVPGHWAEQQWPERRLAAGAGGDRIGTPRPGGAGEWPDAASRVTDPRSAPGGTGPARDRPAGSDPRPAGASRDGPRPGINLPALGGSFEVARSPHVLLLHQHRVAEAAERVELLERVVRSYYLLCAAGGFDLPGPEHRLVAAWFAEHRDYLAFLHSEGADAFRTTLGYYHPTLGAVVTYDVRTHPRSGKCARPLSSVPATRSTSRGGGC